jgi:hypothetical protein
LRNVTRRRPWGGVGRIYAEPCSARFSKRMLRLVVAVSILGLLLPVAANGSVVEAHIKSGRWHGVNWELRGGAWRDGSYCTAMLINGRENSRGCGNVRQQGGIGAGAGGVGSGRRLPNYVMGAVVPRARSVRVEFFGRAPVRLSTIPAPRMLEGGVRFFVAVLPCPAKPRKLIARDATGRIVARYTWQQAPFKWSC